MTNKEIRLRDGITAIFCFGLLILLSLMATWMHGEIYQENDKLHYQVDSLTRALDMANNELARQAEVNSILTETMELPDGTFYYLRVTPEQVADLSKQVPADRVR